MNVKKRHEKRLKQKRVKSTCNAGIDDRINEKSARYRRFVCKRTIKNSHTIHSSSLANPGKNQARIGRLTVRWKGWECSQRREGCWITTGGIKDSQACFAVFVRAALHANPRAGILGGGTQLGNNRCQ